MKPLGIEKQTLLVALIPILVMAVLLENYVIYSRFADLESALLERSQMLVRQLASSSEYAVFSGNVGLLQQNADAALGQQDVIRVAVLDASANPLVGEAGQYETLLAKANSSTPVYQDEDVLILYEPIVATQLKLNDLDLESGLAPAASSAKSLGAVIVEISKQRLISQKHKILLLSLAITLLVLMAALMLALWAAHRISRPIMGMSRVIHCFGEGNLDTRILLQPKVLELDELIKGFNQMAHKLQHHQEILETSVAERTSALAASEQEYRTLIEHTPDTIARYDHDCRRTYVNPAFDAMTGGDVTALLGKKPSESPGGPNSEIYETKIKEVFATGENTRFELKWPGTDGEEICSDICLTAERDLSGAVTSVLGVGHDITELNNFRAELKHANALLESMNVQLQSLATSDPLTQLPNRRLLLDRLRQVLASSMRSGQAGALLFIDLDNFKTINDTLGHHIGDLLLQQVAQRLETSVRQGDTVARIGGDEFVVMLEDLSKDPLEAAAQTAAVGNKILASLNQPYQIASHVCLNSPSIGATLFDNNPLPAEEIMRQADIAMYQAKKAGRNTLRFFDGIIR
jgi:diguanylate cyclase (GGDEF)-like protein/PAS domain S-box-containing protein